VNGELVLDQYPLDLAGLPRGWTVASIGQIARFVGPGFPSGEHNQDERGVPHLRPMNIDREGRLNLTTLKYVAGEIPRELQRGDIIFNNTNSPELIGKTTAILIDTRLAYSNHMTRIQLEDGLSPGFVSRQLHFLWTCGYFRHRCVNHVNQASISGKPLSATVPVLLAPCDEQTRIADAIDELFSDLNAGLAALGRVRQKLRLYRASVLRAAMEGTLTAEWRAQHPNTESADKLLKRILAERRRRWEDDQLAKFKARGEEPPKDWDAEYKGPISRAIVNQPPLPDGWHWSTLGQCFEVHVGATPSRAVAEYWNGNIPWIASGEVQFCRIRDTREKITEAALANSSTKRNPAGSVILNMIGEGSTWEKAGILEVVACNNQNCAAVWVSLTPISPRFVYLWLMFRYEQTRELGSGNNKPAMNKTIIESIALPLPPLAEQEAMIEAVEDHLSVIDHLEADLDAKLGQAGALRQAILRQAFTGQLVAQDPIDDPAPELLKRIAHEREARTGRVGARRTSTANPRALGGRRAPPGRTEDH